jgi:hypothetical protein
MHGDDRASRGTSYYNQHHVTLFVTESQSIIVSLNLTPRVRQPSRYGRPPCPQTGSISPILEAPSIQSLLIHIVNPFTFDLKRKTHFFRAGQLIDAKSTQIPRGKLGRMSSPSPSPLSQQEQSYVGSSQLQCNFHTYLNRRSHLGQ